MNIDLSGCPGSPSRRTGQLFRTLPNRYRVIGRWRVSQHPESACKREGIYVKRIEPQHTTQECHGCGRVEKFNASAMLERGAALRPALGPGLQCREEHPGARPG